MCAGGLEPVLRQTISDSRPTTSWSTLFAISTIIGATAKNTYQIFVFVHTMAREVINLGQKSIANQFDFLSRDTKRKNWLTPSSTRWEKQSLAFSHPVMLHVVKTNASKLLLLPHPTWVIESGSFRRRNLQFMSTSTVVFTGLLRLVLVASQVRRVRRKLRSTSRNVISFLTVPLLRIWYVSSINRPDWVQVTRGTGFPKTDELFTWNSGFYHFCTKNGWKIWMYCVFLKSHFLSRDVLRKYMRAAKVEELSVANCTFSPPSKSLFKKTLLATYILCCWSNLWDATS